MEVKSRWIKQFSITALLVINLSFLWISAFAGQDEDTRGLKPVEYAQYLPKRFAAKRPKSKAAKKNTLTKFIYTPQTTEQVVTPGTDIGFTLWKLRQATKRDDTRVVETQRISIREDGSTNRNDKAKEVLKRFVPERVDSGKELINGDCIRFAVEVPTEGYIYIINQEHYSNDTYSDPYLIFPSQKDVGKTDRAVAGKLLYIPNSTDFFRIASLSENSSEKKAEVFTVIVSPKPLKELPLLESNDPRKITKEEFEKIQNEWKGQVWQFDQDGTAKLSISKVEKDAALQGRAILSEQDLLPQTIFHVAHKPNEPLLFTTAVKLAK